MDWIPVSKDRWHFTLSIDCRILHLDGTQGMPSGLLHRHPLMGVLGRFRKSVGEQVFKDRYRRSHLQVHRGITYGAAQQSQGETTLIKRGSR